MKKAILTLTLLAIATTANALQVNNDIVLHKAATDDTVSMRAEFGTALMGGLFGFKDFGWALYANQGPMALYLRHWNNTVGVIDNEDDDLWSCDGDTDTCVTWAVTGMGEVTATPTPPQWPGMTNLYVKGGKLVAQYRESTTVVRYTVLADLAAGSTVPP